MWTPRHADVASAKTLARIGRGCAGPDGSFISDGAHAEAHRTPRRASVRRNPVANSRKRYFFSFWRADSDLLVDVGAIDRIAVAGQRAVERRDGVVVATELEEHVAVVILDDRVGGQLIGGALQIAFGEIELVGLEVRPAEAESRYDPLSGSISSAFFT